MMSRKRQLCNLKATLHRVTLSTTIPVRLREFTGACLGIRVPSSKPRPRLASFKLFHQTQALETARLQLLSATNMAMHPYPCRPNSLSYIMSQLARPLKMMPWSSVESIQAEMTPRWQSMTTQYFRCQRSIRPTQLWMWSRIQEMQINLK